jgi:toxin ParE1/3/4
MSLGWSISKAAVKDLESIWLFTKHNWSERQADRYYQLIINEIKAICTHPNAGLNYGHIRTGYYASKVKSHLIYYSIKSSKVEFIRILHERMDIMAQFNKP